MKVLVTGCTGYVGKMLIKYFNEQDETFGTSIDCVPDSRHFKCDLCDTEAVKALCSKLHPDIVIHAAGIKDIGLCEESPELASKINTLTTINIARIFGETSFIIYISTDYVFSGLGGQYKEYDKPDPATQYGRSKLAGENEGVLVAPSHFIIARTAALYDEKAAFLTFLYDHLSRGKPVDCFIDAVYSPTYYADFLITIRKIAETCDDGKICHICGPEISRYDFARLFARTFGFDEKLVTPVHAVGRQRFFFPNLSLNGQLTAKMLGITTRSHEQALAEIAGRRR